MTTDVSTSNPKNYSSLNLLEAAQQAMSMKGKKLREKISKHPHLTDEQVEHSRKAGEARLKINKMTPSELFAAKKKAIERNGNTFTAKKVALKDIDIEKMEKVFVVMCINSYFIGVYSCHQKAQQVVDRLGGEYLGDELIIEENRLDDFSIFDRV